MAADSPLAPPAAAAASGTRHASAARHFAWGVVALLWVVAVLNYLDRQLVTTMSGPIKADLSIENAQFGLLSAVFLWVYGGLSPFAGYIADRFPRERVILFSLLVWSACTFATGHVQTFPQMVAARALMGISEACYIPAALAVIVDYHRGTTRALATGLHLSGAYAGSMLGGLGGWIAETHGWRFGFTLFGAVGVGYALFLSLFLNGRRRPPAEEGEVSLVPAAEEAPPAFGQAIAALLANRSFLLLLGMDAFIGAAFWAFRNWLPTFLSMERQISAAQAGILGTSLLSAAAFVGMLAAASLSDRWSLRTTRARTLVPAFALCLAAPALLIVGFVPGMLPLVLTLLLVGAAQGSLDANLMPAVCTVTGNRSRSTAYGLLNLVSTVMGGLMTYLGGVLKDAAVPFAITFTIAAGFTLCAGLLLFAVRPRNV